MASESAPADKSNSEPEASDRALLRRYRDGEDDAATALYLRYAKRLQLLAKAQTGNELALRVDPEDVVQSVFRTFFRRAAKGHYEIPDGDELWKLFLVIALNKIRGLAEYHRASKRDVSNTTPLEKVAPVSLHGDSDDEAAYRVLRLTIDDLLEGVTPVQQQMVELRIAGYNVQEIADETKRSKRSVERVLQKFRELLSEAIHGDVG